MALILIIILSSHLIRSSPTTNAPVVDDQLVNVSGKMMVLERLLEELFRRGSRVLVFSQFVGVLDVIEVSVISVWIR